jgi:hypothetical protein
MLDFKAIAVSGFHALALLGGVAVMAGTAGFAVACGVHLAGLLFHG